MLGHVNVNSLQNKFEWIADVIQGTFDFFYQKLKMIEVSLINSFA